MKDGWEVRPLGEVASIDYGTRIRRADSEGDTYPVYGGGGETFRHGETNRESQLIVSRFGMSEECVRYVEGPFFLNDSGLTVSTTSAPDLDQTFLDRFLHGSQPQIFKLGTGSAQKNLKLPLFRQLPIPLPPMKEQRRIVSVLDEAFEGLARARANIEANLADAEEATHRTAGEQFRALNVPEEPLDTLTVPNTKITYGVVKPGPEGDVPFVRGGDLRDGEIAISELRTISKAVSDQYRRTKLKGGEVLICLVGQPGQTGVVPDTLAGANIARQTALLRFTDEVDPYFASHFLLSDEGQRRLGAYTVGSVQQVINLGDLRTVRMPVPDKETQRKIVDRCAELRATKVEMKAAYTVQLADLATLRQSLLTRAFRGELT